MTQSKLFPVGYLECMTCGRPALWLVENTTYQPMPNSAVKLTVTHELININLIYNHQQLGCYLCDSCECEIPDENIESDYIVFIDDFDQGKAN